MCTQRFFGSVSLFKGLGERDLDHVASVFRLITLEAGGVLCREGERVDYLYLVKRGNLRLLKAFIPLPQTRQQHQQQTEQAEKQVGEDATQRTHGSVPSAPAPANALSDRRICVKLIVNRYI